MSTTRAVARGTLSLLAGLVSAKALDFAFYLVLARSLGVAEFGRYVFALSFTLLFTIVADLGTGTVFTREVARAPNRARALLRHALGVKAILAAVMLAASLSIAAATRTAPLTLALIALFALGLIANSTALLFEGLLKAASRAGEAGLAGLAQSATAFALGGALLVALKAGALAGAVAYLAASLVHLAAAAHLSRDLWMRPSVADPLGRTAREECLALLRESAPIALSGVFIALYFRVDSVLLHAFRGDHDTGLYGGIYRFFEAFVLISAAYRSVLFPILARAADGPPERLRALCRKSIRLHLLFTLAVATFFTFEARSIVTLLLGAPYAEASKGLAILIWALPGAFMADTLLHLLTAQGRQAEGARAASVTAIFNVLLNLALIPAFSFVGASIATAASELLCFALLFRAVRAQVPGIGLAGLARRPLLGAAGLAGSLAALSHALPHTPAGLALAALLGAAVYSGLLVLTGELRSEELRLLAEVGPRGRARS